MTRRLSWPDKKKLEAVQSYILLGSIRQAAIAVAVPYETAKSWYGSQWWKDLEAELRTSTKLALSARLTSVVEKAMEQLNDRIAHGDWVYSRFERKFIRKEINADVLNKIVNTAVDRSIVLEKAATSKQLDEKSIEDRLKKIKEDLLTFVKKPALAKKAINEAEIIDVEPKTEVANPYQFLEGSSEGGIPIPTWEAEGGSWSATPESLSEAGDTNGPPQESTTGDRPSDRSGAVAAETNS